MRTALVTGGAGFIGSHLTERLLADGWRVLVIDDMSTGSEANLAAVRASKRLELTRASIKDETVVDALAARADVVFHLAAAVGVKLIVDDPVRTIETNIHGTEVVLKACAPGRKTVLIASSSEVYGKGSSEKFSEDDDIVFGATTKARWCYGCSKAIDEFLALAYHREFKLPVVILRLFNTVGPRQTGQYGMVLPRFVQQALDGGPITVYSDGSQVRCFTHVADVVEAFVRLAECKAAVGGIFNVGNDEAVTVNQLAERVRALVNPRAKVKHVPYEKVYGKGFEDIRMRVPNVEKLHRTIGFRPTRTLDQIIMEVKAHLSDGRR
jgi:UDP-glucose 4-epimerase